MLAQMAMPTSQILHCGILSTSCHMWPCRLAGLAHWHHPLPVLQRPHITSLLELSSLSWHALQVGRQPGPGRSAFMSEPFTEWT